MKLMTLFLLVLFFISGVFYYVFIDDTTGFISADVVNIVDGDTVDLDGGQRVRLLGVNTPEKSMKYFDEASLYLSDLVLNETVKVETYGFDKYSRILGYVFIDGVNVNREILSNGFATLYYYEHDKYYNDMSRAEDFARMNGLGIWKKSSDYGCVELLELKTDEPERLVLYNECDFDISVLFKDDATHIYREVILAGADFEMEFSHIWNDEGDSLYVWDSEGLILFYRY